MIYQREIEKKFVVAGGAFNRDCWDVAVLLHGEQTEDRITSIDQFWKAPGVDFIRLRENSNEMTVKVTDKLDITDRIEENVKVENTFTASRLLTLLYGSPCLQITKTFSVFHCRMSPAPGVEVEAVVCLYKVKEDPQERLFLEVEAESIEIVNAFVERLTPHLSLTQENRSLFQIFNQGDM